ncbi:MAG: hypothetical protein A3C47_05135 [Omnitrophica bacterium RIFCSPHIGHO2_02_FULL_51_18]|nr:MAG: hypothetical protein A3C47_05135 [Omnitrophica bacterium RIFCSPHIGHO2_02_FULL_51_18]
MFKAPIFFLAMIPVIFLQEAFAETITVTASHPLNIASALETAKDGDVIVVKPGVYHGPLVVNKSVKLIGEGMPVIDGENRGTVVRLEAPEVLFKGFKVINSGDILGNDDAGLVAKAPRCRIEECVFENVLFGVYLKRSPESTLKKNVFKGKTLDVARRGDLLRIWFSDGAVLEDNKTTGGRDAVLWFSRNLRVTGNEFTGGRYGLHFMYCRDAMVEKNRLIRNSVGAYLMYSSGLKLRENFISENRGPSGFGIGFKDMDGALVERNVIVNNRVGLFVDSSTQGSCRENLVAYNDIGLQIFPTARSNRFEQNNVVDNTEQVILDGQSAYTVNDWTGNFWSDYRGFDADRDGVGDVPHRPVKFFERLTDRSHALKIFFGSPSVHAIDFAAATFPVFQPSPKFSDERPLMDSVRLPVRAGGKTASWLWILISAALLSPLLVLFRL